MCRTVVSLYICGPTKTRHVCRDLLEGLGPDISPPASGSPAPSGSASHAKRRREEAPPSAAAALDIPRRLRPAGILYGDPQEYQRLPQPASVRVAWHGLTPRTIGTPRHLGGKISGLCPVSTCCSVARGGG